MFTNSWFELQEKSIDTRFWLGTDDDALHTPSHSINIKAKRKISKQISSARVKRLSVAHTFQTCYVWCFQLSITSKNHTYLLNRFSKTNNNNGWKKNKDWDRTAATWINSTSMPCTRYKMKREPKNRKEKQFTSPLAINKSIRWVSHIRFVHFPWLLYIYLRAW